MITSKNAYTEKSLTYCLHFIFFAVTKNSQSLSSSKRLFFYKLIAVTKAAKTFFIIRQHKHKRHYDTVNTGKNLI